MFCIRALFSYPKIFATFPVLARSDFRLSWHTLPTVISTRRYSIVKERIICGGSYQICRIHYGGSIHFTKYNNIPSTGSQREGTKSAMKFKSFQKVYNCLHFTREFRRACTTKKQHTLQILHGYFSRWIRHLLPHSWKNFNTRRCHLLSPSWKICSLYKGLGKNVYANKMQSFLHI